jgi:hypothetical protein
MEQHRASVRAGLVQHEVEALAEFNIGREQILAKWWEFANIDPAKTGYNTTSQSKALDCLWDALGYADSDLKKPGAEEGEGDPKATFYRAKWMRKPGDPDYEEDEALDTELRVVNPEPVAKPTEPAVVPQAATVRPNGNTMNHAVEPMEPASRFSGANFGRFQGL